MFSFFILKGIDGITQAYQFTQFYASPTFLNPAFAGAGVCQRLTTNYRMQWASIPGAFQTYLLAFDHAIMRKNSGVGVLITTDKAGSGGLSTTSFNAQYSYHLTLSREWRLNAGAQIGYVARSINFDKLIFGDQIAHGTATSVTPQTNDFKGYLDASSGILLYSHDLWIGLSTHHLNTPNQSLLGAKSQLPVLYSVHLGWVIPLVHRGMAGKSITHITPAINYRAQGKFDQFDAGCYYEYSKFVFGLWYRGIPFFKAYKRGYPNHDAVAFLIGTSIERFKFGYSYDLTISWLAGSTGGSHELSLTYQFCQWKRKSAIPCPKF